ncbi:serine integrase [Mycobacterium phage Airmid]|nr:serine integrase [Mycobacterium phage Airmid]
MRVLGRIRLSRVMEESTSVERQREIIETWARQNDHEIIGWAEDLDVSGSVDPFETPALGPWLTDHRKHEWDILVAWKLDRLSRRAIPMNKLFGWVMENDKTLVCVSENLDLSTWIGRMIANVIAGVAEGELEAIRERTKGSQKKLRELGRWGGGKPYYGYRAQEREDAAGWELVPDEHASKVLLSIIEKVLEGQSTESIARELNERGELSPSDYLRHRAGKPTRGGKWSNAHIRQQLRSKTLLGYSTHNGETIRDERGIAVRKGPALVSQDVFDRLQAALDSRSFKVTNRSAKASPLLGVLVCRVCERPMHLRQHHNKKRGKTYRYYQCVGGVEKTHPANLTNADQMEQLVEESFLAELGDRKIQERVYIPAESHRAELDEAVRAVEEITPLLGTVTSDTMRKRLLDQLSALDARISELEKLPESEARWEYREGDETYAEAWNRGDAEARRQLLLKSGITAAAEMKGREARVNPGVLHFDLRIPEDILERMSA